MPSAVVADHLIETSCEQAILLGVIKWPTVVSSCRDVEEYRNAVQTTKTKEKANGLMPLRIGQLAYIHALASC